MIFKNSSHFSAQNRVFLCVIGIGLIIFGYCLGKINTVKSIIQRTWHNRKNIISNLNDKTMVALVIGQSNAANHCQKKYNAKNNVFVFYNNTYYLAKDPLPGASGKKGSIWSQLGDRLIEKKMFDNVVFSVLAQGSTKVSDWSHSGSQNKRLVTGILFLKSKLNISHIIYSQGEQDNLTGTSGSEYEKDLSKIILQIRELQINCPIFITVTSFNPMAKNGNYINHSIRMAQENVISKYENVFSGPDTDAYDKAFHRYDGIHFSTIGVKAIVEEWLFVLNGRKK